MSFPLDKPASSNNKATTIYPNLKDFDSTKQGCHHLQATSTNRGMRVRSTLDTTSTLYFTNSSLGQEHSSLSGVLGYGHPLKLINTQSNNS